LVRKLNIVDACIICTNQVSDSFLRGGFAGRRPHSLSPSDDDYISYGGKALKYYASHRIFLYRMPVKYRFKGSLFADAFLVGFTTIKNRLRKPLRDGRMVLSFHRTKGGFNDDYSKLETLLLLKCADYKDGNITFKFRRNRIETKTFKSRGKSLDEQDDDPTVGRREPYITDRSDWPAFYVEHKEDLDLLWQAGIRRAFQDDVSEITDDENPEENLEEEEIA